MMFKFPEYHDVLNKYKKGQLPFYISINTLHSSSLLHHHDFAELSLVIEGTGNEILNGISHEMKPGTSSFLLPHHIHEIHNNPGSQIRTYCCMFDINILFDSPIDAELGRMLLGSGQDYSSYVDMTEGDIVQLKKIFDDIIHEFHCSMPGKNSFIRAKLTEALLLFIRAHNHQFDIPAFSSNTKILDILRYIHLHYADELSLYSLALKFELSVPHICRLFKEHVGESFLEYLHNLRIQSACNLLVSTKMPIADISVEVGFESYRTFSRVFNQFKGVSPTNYRMYN